MNKSSPFYAHELLPQEEMLDVSRESNKLVIGIPKERHLQETRIALTPDSVSDLVKDGHSVLIESNAGISAGFTDHDYSEAGAQITPNTQKVFESPIVLKVEPPTIDEAQWLKPNSVLISALQIKSQSKAFFELLQKKKISAIAFEYVKEQDGDYPILQTLSELAGTSSIVIASELLSQHESSTGLLLGNIAGVAPTEVVIIGAGTVGYYAAKTAIGLGAKVKVFDPSINRLRKLQSRFNENIQTSTIQPKSLLKAIRRCNVIIGALKGADRTPLVVSEELVEFMKKGSVIVDVSIDSGGCIETSRLTTHEDPTFVLHEVIHYGVPNISARYPRTASLAISNILAPFLMNIGNHGGIDQSIRFNYGLRSGTYMYKGILTNRTISNWFDLTSRDINLLIF
ncbi:MAG: alanine dehydrogenase [Bacteroidetes bacterium]|nr:alanine dehydrogenase [Bacteroidota bacterium]